MKCAAYGILAVLFGVAIFLGIAVATSHAFIGVPSSILALVLTGAMLSLASAQEKFVLLCQRIARIGKVERFERAELDDDVRTHFQSTVSVTDEEMPLDPFWLCDEKLISLLRRLNSGKEVHTFETLADETPLVSVEGNPVNKVYDQTRATISRTEIDPFLKL